MMLQIVLSGILVGGDVVHEIDNDGNNDGNDDKRMLKNEDHSKRALCRCCG